MNKRGEAKLRKAALKVHGVAGDNGTVYLETDQFSEKMLESCRRRFRQLQKENKVTGRFEDEAWEIYNEVTRTAIRFGMDPDAYDTHGRRYTHLSYDVMILAVKCYVILHIKSVIANTIRQKLCTIRTALENVGSDFELPEAGKEEFGAVLYFCGISEQDRIAALQTIRPMRIEDNDRQRTLAHIITYMILDREIEELFANGTEEERLRFFPLYFWCKVTFVLPLRATETTLTPRDCIVRKDGKVYLKVIRTQLKKKRGAVEYLVARDYKDFEYPIPDGEIVRNIEWYLDRTKDIDREYLFVSEHTKTDAPLFRLTHLNALIEEFMEEHVKHSHKYDFAKAMAGLSEFEKVTAGDARHIALANMFFSGVNLEVCRQLADHECIDASVHYATNVQKTLESSAIMRVQRMIQEGLIEHKYRISTPTDEPVCLSELRRADPLAIEDCEQNQHLSRCLGCPLYVPTDAELQKELQKQKDDVFKQAQALQKLLILDAKVKNQDEELRQAILTARTAAARYIDVLDIKYRKGAIQWQDQGIIGTTAS